MGGFIILVLAESQRINWIEGSDSAECSRINVLQENWVDKNISVSDIPDPRTAQDDGIDDRNMQAVL